MRYHYERPKDYTVTKGYTYICEHPVYSRCTLYFENGIGLSVIQQRYNERVKCTWWEEIDEWLVDDIYNQEVFHEFFASRADKKDKNGIFPTVTVRQLMNKLGMKPIKKERWETVFDRREI